MILSYSGTVVSRLDADLNELWSWRFSDGQLSKQVVLDDGNIMLIGSSTSVGMGGYDTILIKIDSDGNILDSATLGSTEDKYVRMVQATENGELLLGGTTSAVDPTTSLGYILRIGENFELSSCAPFTLQPWTPQKTAFSYSFDAISAYNSSKSTSLTNITATELVLGINMPASYATPW